MALSPSLLTPLGTHLPDLDVGVLHGVRVGADETLHVT